MLLAGLVIPLLNKLYNTWENNDAKQKAEIESTRDCPACLSRIPSAATKCKHCASDVSALIPQAKVAKEAQVVQKRLADEIRSKQELAEKEEAARVLAAQEREQIEKIESERFERDQLQSYSPARRFIATHKTLSIGIVLVVAVALILVNNRNKVMGYLVVPGAHLSGANLAGADLSNANLAGADLSNAALSNTALSGANLSGANLSNAALFGSDLYGTNLSGADLSGADLSNAALTGANLSGANLTGANLSGTVLSGANLSGVISSSIIGSPYGLPTGWQLIDGVLSQIE
jgi:uncharacterized protein YjbI with pentapeptide repeats